MLGEDIAAAGGVFKVDRGLAGAVRRRPGPRHADLRAGDRRRRGGRRLKGMRPIAEIMFADFAGICFDQIVNQMAKYRYMTGGQVSLPVTMRLVNGAGAGIGVAALPNGGELVPERGRASRSSFPATVADAYGLLLAAVRAEDPVLVFEHKRMYASRGQLEDGRPDRDRQGGGGSARGARDRGRDAADAPARRAGREQLAEAGIEVELIDPRSVVPLDVQTIGASVERTNRLVVVQESPEGGSWGASVVASVARHHFEALDAPPVLVCGPDTPVPYARVLEEAWLPSVERIRTEVSALVGA